MPCPTSGDCLVKGLEKAALRSAARLTALPKSITDRPKLPAGTATSPTQLKSFLNEYGQYTDDLSNKYPEFTKALQKQPDMAIGLGLFDALHIIEPYHQRRNFSIESLIEEVISNLNDLNQLIEAKRQEITEWMEKKRAEVPIPIYGSVDVRDAGWKIAVVDANHFPAGFNNVAPEDEQHLSALLKNHINRRDEKCRWVHLYPESHTRNAAYVENLKTLQRLIEQAGFRCTVGSPELADHGSLAGISGPLNLDIVSLQLVNDEESIVVNGEQPDLILLNNDLTEGIVPGWV